MKEKMFKVITKHDKTIFNLTLIELVDCFTIAERNRINFFKIGQKESFRGWSVERIN